MWAKKNTLELINKAKLIKVIVIHSKTYILMNKELY